MELLYVLEFLIWIWWNKFWSNCYLLLFEKRFYYIYGFSTLKIFWALWLWNYYKFWSFYLNMAKQILVKLWFLVVGNMFLLYAWIQHPRKPLGHRDCGEFTIQICNSNKFLPNSKQILRENISRKNTKKYVMAYIFLNSRPGMLIAISLKILLVIWQEVVRSQDSNVRICKYVKSSCWWTISVIPK